MDYLDGVLFVETKVRSMMRIANSLFVLISAIERLHY